MTTQDPTSVAVVFGGQGGQWLDGLRELHHAHAAVRTLVGAATERLRASAADARLSALATPARGFDLARWMDDPDAAPPPEVLSELAGLAGGHLPDLRRPSAGHGRARLDLDGSRRSARRHGATPRGSWPRCSSPRAAARAARGPGGSEIASYFFWQGYRMQESFVLATVPPAVRAAAEQAGVGEPSPMAAIAGLTSELLAEALARFHAANPQLPPIDVALDNGYARKVVSGPPATLVAFARALAAFRDAEKQAFARGASVAGPSTSSGSSSTPRRRSTRATWTPAAVRCRHDLAREGIGFDPAALRLPVLGNDGTDLRVPPTRRRCGGPRAHAARRAGALGRCAPRCGRATRGRDARARLRARRRRGQTHGAQLPGLRGARLPARHRGRPQTALGPPRQLPRGLGLPTLRPDAPAHADRRGVLDNAWRRVHRAAARLPAGHDADHGGRAHRGRGGQRRLRQPSSPGARQVTERHFRLRAAELSRTLEPGAAYVVNLLYLDPYLWSLHWKGEGLMRSCGPRARPSRASRSPRASPSWTRPRSSSRRAARWARARVVQAGTAKQVQRCSPSPGPAPT
jgi:hypothetical protein